MAKEIIKYPNPSLKKKCKEIEEITEEIKNLSKEMIETLIERQGLGLAAPQVGESKKLIVAQINQSPEVFINPKIIKKSKEFLILEEGCLSFPGLFLKIKRAKEIEIEALNLKGEEIKIKAKGLPSIIFQHEIDHLNGILIINKVCFWLRLKLMLKR